MRSLTLGILFVMVLGAPAFAHNGALSLYTDSGIGDCDLTSGMFVTDTIQLFYVRGSGPEMGNAAQFRIEKSSEMVLFTPDPEWTPLVNLTIGDIQSGIAITAAACLGSGMNIVYLGNIYVFNMTELGMFTVKVVAYPLSVPPAINITICDPGQTVYSVLGGTFVFNGTCNPATEETSWGAIKSLYR